MGSRLHNWKEIKLGAVCKKIGSGATPRGGAKVYTERGVSLIRSQNVHNSGFQKNGLAHIGETHAKQLAGVTVEPHDVLLNITGDSVARTCQVDAAILPARVNQHVAIVRPQEDLLTPRYLRYVLVQPSMQQHLLGLASSGATRNALTKQMIEDLSLFLPPLPEQKAIATVLSSLDDKIELLRRQNETLEKVTQAIFKEWFVEFNFPDKNSRPYKASGGKMVDSELGTIPKGWRVGQLGDLLETEIGGDWGNETLQDGLIPAISLRGTDLQAIKELGHAPEAPVRFVTPASLKKRRVSNKDVLVGGSGLGPIGRSLYCHESLRHLYPHPILYSNFCKRYSACNPETAMYAEYVIESLYRSGRLAKYYTGTSIPNLDGQKMLFEPVVIPTSEAICDFAVLIECRLSKFYSGQILTLTNIRDTLLPKLMNGEIRLGG